MSKPERYTFALRNYCLILASVILLIIGFVLMAGENNSVVGSFNLNIYSFRRITLAPLIILAGYTLMIFAIMSVSGKHKES